MINTITAAYPGFQALPKGVKQMLLLSESLFFEEARPEPLPSARPRPPAAGRSFSLAQMIPPLPRLPSKFSR